MKPVMAQSAQDAKPRLVSMIDLPVEPDHQRPDISEKILGPAGSGWQDAYTNRLLLVEIFRVRRRLPLPGWHQVSVAAEVVKLLADEDLRIDLGAHPFD